MFSNYKKTSCSEKCFGLFTNAFWHLHQPRLKYINKTENNQLVSSQFIASSLKLNL